METRECIIYTLPKSVTSVKLSGKSSESFANVKKWLDTVCEEYSFSNLGMKLVIPSCEMNDIDLSFLTSKFGTYREVGGVGSADGSTYTSIFIEFDISLSQLQEVFNLYEEHKKVLDVFHFTIYVAINFTLKSVSDNIPAPSNLLVGFGYRNFVMPYVAFPFNRLRDMDHFLKNFIASAPFVINPKYLRLYKATKNGFVLKKVF